MTTSDIFVVATIGGQDTVFVGDGITDGSATALTSQGEGQKLWEVGLGSRLTRLRAKLSDGSQLTLLDVLDNGSNSICQFSAAEAQSAAFNSPWDLDTKDIPLNIPITKGHVLKATTAD